MIPVIFIAMLATGGTVTLNLSDYPVIEPVLRASGHLAPAWTRLVGPTGATLLVEGESDEYVAAIEAAYWAHYGDPYRVYDDWVLSTSVVSECRLRTATRRQDVSLYHDASWVAGLAAPRPGTVLFVRAPYLPAFPRERYPVPVCDPPGVLSAPPVVPR